MATTFSRHALKRLLLAFLVAPVLICALGFWFFVTANQQTSNSRRAGAEEHFKGVLAALEQRWGREAFDFKIRLEAMHILETPKRQERLLTYLTAQGSSLPFPSLRIENLRGEVLATFEDINHSTPRVKFRHGQDAAWGLAENNRLYLAIRQMIWLGNENGYIVLYKPMDNALLSQHNSPLTRLSLWWQDIPVASSDGNDGIIAIKSVLVDPKYEQTLSKLNWPAGEPGNVPVLYIESTAPPLLPTNTLALALAICTLLYFTLIWAILGNEWLVRFFRTLTPAPSSLSDEARHG